MRSLDFIINTVGSPHSLGPILELLTVKGILSIVGAPDKPLELPAFPLIFGKSCENYQLFSLGLQSSE